jgi:undecaprenyl-diphosphatase
VVVRRTRAGQYRGPFTRRFEDVVRAVIGAGVLVLCSVVAWGWSLSDLEERLFDSINGLPDWLYRPLWLVMQLGAFGAVFIVAAVALCLRRVRLAVELLGAGVAAYFAAIGLKHVIGRARPTELLNDVVIHGSAAHGLGFPSGHAAVSCALAATAVPFLVGRARLVVWLIPIAVGFARIYVGAHFPLDVLGGFALGYMIAALTHLAGGVPVEP